jgi:hypothetical protein
MMRIFTMAAVAGVLIAGAFATSAAQARIHRPGTNNSSPSEVNAERGIGDRQEGNRSYYRAVTTHHRRHHHH